MNKYIYIEIRRTRMTSHLCYPAYYFWDCVVSNPVKHDHKELWRTQHCHRQTLVAHTARQELDH